MTDNTESKDNLSKSSKVEKVGKFIADVATTAPYVGGLIAAVKGAYQDHQQEKANNFIHNWISMIQDEMKEKQQTIIEIMARIDLQDEQIGQKVSSSEFQSLSKKAFRDWGAAESEDKRVYIRNILSNTAADKSNAYSYDVIRMFLDWIKTYSDLHFNVVKII